MADEAILLRIGADASQLTKELRMARKELGVFGDGIAGLGSQITGLVATAAAGIGVAKLVGDALEFADAVRKVADQTGLATDAVQFLRFAADQTGTSVDSLAALVGKMQTQLVEASNGNKEVAQGIAGLGLDLTELRAMRPEEQFQAIASAIATIPDPAERATAANMAFGKSGKDALPQIIALGEGGQALRDQFEALGGPVSEDAINAVDLLGDTAAESKVAITALATEVVSELAPAFVAALQTLNEFIGGLRVLDGEGSNAAVNLDNKLRAAEQTLNTMRIAAERGDPFFNGERMDEAMAKQERVVQLLRDEYDALQGLGLAGAAAAAKDKQLTEMFAMNSEERIGNLLASLEGENAIRIASQLKIETGEAEHLARLALMREEARVAEMERVLEFNAQYENEMVASQERLMGNMEAGLDTSKLQYEQSYGAMTHTVAGELEKQTAGVARHSKAMFELNKAAGITNAIVNTITAVTKAWSDYGWPVGAIMGAAIAAAGAVQVQTIANQKFGQTGGLAPSQSTTPPTPTAPQGGGGNGQGGGDRTLRVQGIDPAKMFSGGMVRGLVAEIAEFQKDGGTVVLQ